MSLNSVIGALRVDLSLAHAQFSAGVAKVQSQSRNLAQRLNINMASITKAVRAMAIAAAAAFAAAGAAFAAMTTRYVSHAKDIQVVSDRLGMQTDAYQRLTAAASRYGLEGDKVADQIKDFNEKLGEYAATGAGGFADFFELYGNAAGISADDLLGMDVEQRLQTVQNTLEAAGASLEEQSFIWESIASDTTNLIPLLRNQGAEYARINDELIRTGQILSSDVIANLVAVGDNTTRIRGALSGLGNIFISQIAPQLAAGSQSFADWIESSEALRTGVANAGQAVGRVMTFVGDTFTWLRGRFEPVFTSLQGYITTAQTAFNNIGQAIQNNGPLFTWLTDVLAGTLSLALRLGSGIVSGLGRAIPAIINFFGQLVHEGRSAFVNISEFGSAGVDAIKIAFAAIPDYVGSVFINLTNTVLGGLEDVANLVIDKVRWIAEQFNKLPGVTIDVEAMGPVSWEIPNTFSTSVDNAAQQIEDRWTLAGQNALRRIGEFTPRSTSSNPTFAPDLNRIRPVIAGLTPTPTTANTPASPASAASGGGSSRDARDQVEELTDATKALQAAGDDMKQTFTGAFTDMLTGAKSVRQGLADVFSEIAKNMMNKAVSSFLTALIPSGGGSWWNSLASGLGFGKIGKNANGTTNWQGGLSMVGERGPELLNLPRNSRVYDAQSTKQMLRGAGSGSSSVRIDLGEGLVASILQEAHQGAVQVTQSGLNSFGKTINGRIATYSNDPRARG